MGSTSSVEISGEENHNLKGKKNEKRKYNVPEVREAHRFEQTGNASTVNLFEAAVDKVSC